VSPAAAGYWPALFAMLDVWLPRELCKIRNPLSPQNACMPTGGCAILFREIIFRGMNVLVPRPKVSPVPARLDAIDRKILKELQADGRITNVELASRVGISAPPCLRRVRGLEEAGYIKGYRALLDEKKLGYEVTVFAMVHLASQAETDLVAFEEFVRSQPLVRECWMLSGEIDFVLKCVAPDLKTFQAFVEKLTAAPNVRNVKTSLTLRNSKDAAMVPMD
jgi:DNA-binding Lrp family transcriptional regulator